MKRFAKRNYYIHKCSEFKRNTKKLWQTINHIVGKSHDKSCSITHLTIDGCQEYEAKKITNHLNTHFANIGEKYAKQIGKPNHDLLYYLPKIRQNEQCIFMTSTTRSQTLKLIQNVPNKTSSGFDEIDNVLLKAIAEPILTIG